MEDVNKVFSLVLGLIVVILFFAVITGKINLKNRFSSLFAGRKSAQEKVTPTPTPISRLSIITQNKKNNKTNENNTNNITRPDEIPSTGLPTEVFISLWGALPAGYFLRRIKR